MNREMLDRFYVELTNPDEMGITDSRLETVFDLARQALSARPEVERIERNCGNCKHRGNEPVDATKWEGDKLVGVTYYQCKRIHHGNESGLDEDYKAGEEALVEDMSGCHAALVVEPTFFCKFHEREPQRDISREEK